MLGDSVNPTAKRAAGIVVLTIMALAGCATVEPWDRDVLARPDMQIVSDPSEAAADEHIYFSKEASSGGQGFGGGGCGCN
jgi:Domain of unknown function (DUF4266)